MTKYIQNVFQTILLKLTYIVIHLVIDSQITIFFFSLLTFSAQSHYYFYERTVAMCGSESANYFKCEQKKKQKILQLELRMVLAARSCMCVYFFQCCITCEVFNVYSNECKIRFFDFLKVVCFVLFAFYYYYYYSCCAVETMPR